MVTDTYKQGRYTAKVTDDFYVELEADDVLFDRPGPWGDYEGARQWAQLIVGKYHLENP